MKTRPHFAHVPAPASRPPHKQIQPTACAGFPTTIAWSGTSAITTLPAPTSACFPMTVPHTIVQLAPSVAPSRTSVGVHSSGGVRYSPARDHVVREHGVRTGEHVVFQRDEPPHRDAVLDDDAVAETRVVLDERALADVAVAADDRTVLNMRERPDPGTGPDRLRVAETHRMHEHVTLAHRRAPARSTAPRNTLTTCSCCSGRRCGCMGSERIRSAAVSASGNVPRPIAASANAGCRCTGTG